MPANAGIQSIMKIRDPGFRKDEGKREFRTFYQTVKVALFGKGLMRSARGSARTVQGRDFCLHRGCHQVHGIGF